MSYDEYWHGDPLLVISYEKAKDIKLKMDNDVAYLQGMYNFKAFEAIMANVMNGLSGKRGSVASYPSKPRRITPMTDEEKQEEVRKTREKVQNQLKAWSDRVRANKD